MDFDILFSFAAVLTGTVVVMDLYLAFRFFQRLRRKGESHIADVDAPVSAPKSKLRQTKDTITDTIWPFRYAIVHIVFLGIAAYLLYLGLTPLPIIQSSYPSTDSNWNDYTQPITIVFNEPVQISKLHPNLSVESLKGEWKYEKYLGFLPVTRVAKFYPATSLLPNQRIVVYMTGVARWGVTENNEHALNFFSQKEPEIQYAEPANNSTEVDVNTGIVFHLTSPNQPYDKWDFEITPKVDFQVQTPDPYTIILKPNKALVQSQKYDINVYRTAVIYNISNQQEISRDNRQLIHQLSFTARKAPLVKRFTPTGTGIKVDTSIEIVFDLPMQSDVVEAGWKISPPVQGNFIWKNAQTLTFTPTSALAKETEYTVTLPAGMRSLNGGISESVISYSFTTIGAVRVNSAAPSNGSVRVARNTQIRINFDQEVDHNSAQSRFSISPTATGDITWEGNNLVFTPTAPLAFSTTYTVSLSPGVQGIYGLDSRDNFTSTFNTVSNQTVIAGFNIDLQDYDFTCGVAAAKMMLAWKGINTSEDTLVSIMGEDTSPWQWNASLGTHTWGNPNRAFLGWHVDGSGYIPGDGEDNTHPAYGALWYPIIKAYQAYGVQTELHQGWDLVSMAHAIDAGHPVQIWWYNGVSGGQTLTWSDNVTGATIYAIEGMHSVDVIGFNGDVDNPTSFIVMDPWWGFQTYSNAKFDWQWPYLGNTALVVY